MATRKRVVPDMSQPLTPLQIEQLSQERQRQERREVVAPTLEASAAALNGTDYEVERRSHLVDSISQMPRKFVLACALIGALGVGSFMGSVGQSWVKASADNHALAQSLRTTIPVVRALDIDVDPGKYDGKLLDVVMDITKGGVYKSGKGLYLQERDQGFALVVFESAFAGFLVDGEKPDSIVSRYVGKTVRARGTVRSFGQQKDGEKRMSMVVSAPGLLSEVPQR